MLFWEKALLKTAKVAIFRLRDASYVASVVLFLFESYLFFVLVVNSRLNRRLFISVWALAFGALSDLWRLVESDHFGASFNWLSYARVHRRVIVWVLQLLMFIQWEFSSFFVENMVLRQEIFRVFYVEHVGKRWFILVCKEYFDAWGSLVDCLRTYLRR